MHDEQAYTAEGQAQLSPEDLAIIEAFLEMDDLEPPEGGLAPSPEAAADSAPGTLAAPSALDDEGLDDMLQLFIAEAEEEIGVMRQALTRLEQGDTLNEEHLETLRRSAHKLKGTAGAVGCTSMSTIAYYIEMLIASIRDSSVPVMIGLMALVQAMRALESTLQSLIVSGQESSGPLTELEADYEALNEFGGMYHAPSESLLALTGAHEARLLEQDASPATSLKEEIAHFHLSAHPAREVYAPLPSVHVDAGRLKQLVLNSEHLAEQREPLENAHRELEAALQELYAAQSRLQYLEALLSLDPLAAGDSGQALRTSSAQQLQQPMSSLVARILEEAEQHGKYPVPHLQHRGRGQSLALKAREATSWDEMEVDRYTEHDVVLRAFSEAIADVSTASAQVRTAFMRLDRALRRHMDLANKVRSDTLLLRSAPLAVLLPRVQRAIRMSADAQRRRVAFATRGESTEVDQDILEALARPLLQLVRYGMIDNLSTARDDEEEEQEHRIWLNARAVGNEVSLELGFSMPVRAGALELVQGPIQQLQGTVSAQRNTHGGMTFYLTLPRSHGAMHGLLVRVGRQRLVLPFSQVRRIDYDHSRRAVLPSPLPLGALLGLPLEPGATQWQGRPLLLLQEGLPYEAIEVDEVLGGVELVVRPLAPYLRRPGVMGAAVDGQGNVLLVADLARPLGAVSGAESGRPSQGERTEVDDSSAQSSQRVMIADDSVYIRQSLRQTLLRAGYQVMQARDGMEAWELLLEQPPDVLLLDIEMPNLNGYELLSMIRTIPRFAALKIIMLTARSSEKHRRSARELGAHAYLIKPSPPETLLATIQAVLTAAEDEPEAGAGEVMAAAPAPPASAAITRPLRQSGQPPAPVSAHPEDPRRRRE